MPDEYVLRLEASGEVTRVSPEERRAAEAYGRALTTPPSAEASAYIRDRVSGSSAPRATAHPDDTAETEEVEQ